MSVVNTVRSPIEGREAILTLRRKIVYRTSCTPRYIVGEGASYIPHINPGQCVNAYFCLFAVHTMYTIHTHVQDTSHIQHQPQFKENTPHWVHKKLNAAKLGHIPMIYVYYLIVP